MPKLGLDGLDLSAIGSSAVGSKRAGAAPQELTSFSVKKGDNGGVLVCETYAKKPPAGRRAGAAYPGGGDYKENPFSPDDGAAAASHVTGLLSQMGVVSAPEPPAPTVTAARGPTASAVGLQGPRGSALAMGPRPGPFEAPDEGGY